MSATALATRGGELRIGRLEFDRDHARLVDREDGQPLVIGFEHALFGVMLERILGEPEEAERIAHQRHAAQRGIEFRQLAELELLDHLAGEIARQRELHLAGHRFRIDGAVALVAPFSASGRKNTFSRPSIRMRASDLYRGVIRLTPTKVSAATAMRRTEHPPLLAHQRAADRAEIELAVPCGIVHHRTATCSLIANSATVRDHATDATPSETIKVAVALIVPPRRGGW